MLCFRLSDEFKARKESNTWDGQRLREVIDTEMLRIGVPTYEIVEVDGFIELEKNTGRPCNVIARTGDDEQIIRVFRNGDSYSIRQVHP
ncbi:MAG: hypothetical protein AAGG48_26930 [Planctomycetota bacterium]